MILQLSILWIPCATTYKATGKPQRLQSANPSIGVILIQTILQKKHAHYFHGLQLAGPPARVRETFELNQLKSAPSMAYGPELFID
jgi:hypothetical protein